jgi:Ni/Co efflux regulator RcnB
MKWLILTLAAVAGVATAFPASDAAWAQGRGRGAEHRQERGYERARGQDRQRGPERPRRSDRERDYERRGPERRFEEDRPRDTRPALGYERRERDERRGGRNWDEERPRTGARRGYDGGPSTTRQRGFGSQAYRGAVVEDYRRYRLRPPPHGYAWVRMGDGFALISLDDGQIFDRVR